MILIQEFRMEKKIVLFSEKNTLLVNVLSEGLYKAGFSIEEFRTGEKEVKDITSGAQIWMVYLPGEETDFRDSYTDIKRALEMDENIHLFLVGNPTELKAETEFFGTKLVAGAFARPFRVEDIVETMTSFVSGGGASKRILVVDDDATALSTIKTMLSGSYNIFTANSAFNAVRVLDKTPIDLILLDYEMPIIKGPQVLELLRNDPGTKHVPVMFLTSKNDKETISEALSLRPEKYLLKSLPQSELLKAIEMFFEGK